MKSIVTKSIYFLAALALCLGSFRIYKHFANWPYLTVIGSVDMCDGLGRQSAELIETMKDEVRTNFVTTYIGSWMDVTQPIKKLAKKKDTRLGKVIVAQEPLERITPILKTPIKPNQIRIAYSMFESTRLPEKTVMKLNRFFDAVAVPDPFLVEVYQQSGIQIPIFVLPLGRDLTDFINAPLKTKRKTPLVFGNLSSGIERKNQVALVRSFYKAFGNRKDVRLVLNCRGYTPEVKTQIERVIEHLGAENIRFTQHRFDHESYLELFSNIDCYVSVSKGEGFSIQPREAMAMGIPSIVTDNTAQHTICESGLVKVIPSSYPELAMYEWSPSTAFGYFFGCDQDEIVNALLDVESNYEKYLEKSAEARNWAAQYDFNALKPLYRTLIKPSKIVLGETNSITADCLTTNSKTLYEKYIRLTQ